MWRFSASITCVVAIFGIHIGITSTLCVDHRYVLHSSDCNGRCSSGFGISRFQLVDFVCSQLALFQNDPKSFEMRERIRKALTAISLVSSFGFMNEFM